ncbi:AAA family ATPase [Paenibacillus macerans]|uniref:AAA family ATPase n=1 Tax=Paenibacillus macerans TaxID=44252 RepID=UPI002DBE9A66|nr:AAA family ATPase [Paenibacillus macerans]MEC0329089.1 AAA family ATPase [Paenibacillus macerans]
MIYLRSFKLSSYTSRNPNIYPDYVFKHLAGEVLWFDRITVLYGSNGSGKSTLLNVIANKLGITGSERMTSDGHSIYAQRFLEMSSYQFGHDEREHEIKQLPDGSRYMKSEDILYEIKKIQQSAVLREGMLYEQINKGMSKAQAEQYEQSYAFKKKLENIQFSQEKYSNGETSMQFFEQYLLPGQLYLLDEPETSLSPANQIKLAEQINELARYFDSQFIIATHSPFVLGTLHAKIYNLDAKLLQTAEWFELDNVQFFYRFFHKHKRLFE